MSKKLRFGFELLAFFIGGFIFIAILRSFGLKEVISILSQAGASSLVVFLFYPVMTLWDVAAWKKVFVPEVSRKLDTLQLFLIRLAGEAINNITPFIDVGGEPLKIHLLVHRQGVHPQQAVSAIVVAKTSMLVSEAFFMLTGFFLSYSTMSLPDRSRHKLSWTLFVVSALFFAFLWAQQHGSFQKLNTDIQAFYKRHWVRFWTAVPLNWVGWIAGGVETYFFCRIIGLPVTIWEGIMLEALTQLVRTGTFFIPMNLGVQEGSMAFFVQQMGHSPVQGVALSLLKRSRQLLWTAVGFMIWAAFQYEDARKKIVDIRDESFLSFDTWLDRQIHRPPALWLADLLAKTPVTPNQVTLLGVGVALVSAIFFSLGSFSGSLVGLVFFYAWSVLDHIDGSLARLRKQFSKWGELLDDTCDILGSTLVLLGVFLGLIPLWNDHDAQVISIWFYAGLALNAVLGFWAVRAKRVSRRHALRQKKATQRFVWKHHLLDRLNGRDTFYFFLAIVVLTHAFGSIAWGLYTFTMGILIIGSAVLSVISLKGSGTSDG